MAKIYGINNDIVGRVGNEVFERQGNANIVRGYNPHHSGTPSKAQLVQKTRLDCMGNWERRLPLQAVEAFNGNKSQKWSAFVRKNMPLVRPRYWSDGHIDAIIAYALIMEDPSRLILGGEDIGMKVMPQDLRIYKNEGTDHYTFSMMSIILQAPTLARYMIMGIPKSGDTNGVLFAYLDILHNTAATGELSVNPFGNIEATHFYWVYVVQQINIVSVENFMKSNNWVQKWQMSAGDRTTLLSNVSFCKGQMMIGKIM